MFGGIFILYEVSRPPFAQALEQLSSLCPWLAISCQQNSVSCDLEEKKKYRRDPKLGFTSEDP